MYKICILGSGPERFADHDKIRRLIGQTINLLGFQYQNVIFHVRGEIGVGLWTAQACLEEGYKYHLFLPYSPEETSKHWYDGQQEDLMEQYNNAYSLTILKPLGDFDKGSYLSQLDDSNFVVSFWSGESDIYLEDAIGYAIEKSKIVLNGLDDLRLMTYKDLAKRKK